MSDPLTINGSQLRQSRESLGWSLGEVASRACLSVKQVRQLEEGGASSFYSDNVKLTAARKVAGILGVSEGELLGSPIEEHAEDSAPIASYSHESTNVSVEQTNASEEAHQAHTPNIDLEPAIASVQAAPGSQPILVPGVQALTMRSEVLHFLAQPPEEGHEDQHLDGAPELTDSSVQHESENLARSNESADLESVPDQPPAYSDHVSSEHQDLEVDAQNSSLKDENKSSSASNLLKIIVLFLLALGIAAFFAQKTNEEHSEPPPPLQVVPESSTTDSNAKPEDSANAISTGNPVNAGAGGNASSNGNGNAIGNNNNSNNSNNSSNGSTSNNPANPALKSTAPTPSKSPNADQKPLAPAPGASAPASSVPNNNTTSSTN